MKRRKIKLFASVASFALVAAVMSFGVFAAVSHSVQVTSTVSFTSNEITGTFTATVDNDTTADGVIDTATYAFGPKTTAANPYELDAVSFVTVAQDDAQDIAKDIVYTFDVTDVNYASTMSIAVAYWDAEAQEGAGAWTDISAAVAGDFVAIANTNLNYKLSATSVATSEGEATITFTINVVDTSVAVEDVKLQFSLGIEKA